VGGFTRSYTLRPGGNCLGSASGNEIVLSARGVSRRHALLKLEPQGLTLEDLGSKNGTLVNGVRIQRSRLETGDLIRVGTVTLKLEEVELEDATLAIAVLGADVPSPPSPARDTTETSAAEPGRIGIALLESLVLRLTATPEPDFPGLLVLLARELGASSACFFELDGREAVALAACGSLPDLAGHSGFVQFAQGAVGPGATVRAASLPGDPALTCALSTGSAPRKVFGLVLAGEVTGRREEIEGLLRLLLGLAFRLRPLPRGAAPGRHAPPAERSLVFPEGYLPGESPAVRLLHDQMRPLVQGDLPVLLLGETGVGKEFLARILHDSSARKRGPFVAINCAAIPADLLESEMFGIGKGIATGVVERPGKFQLAEGGTLFLDEIGDMPLALQAKLLRALQEKEVQPVGGAPVPVDIRVVAATNSDLHRRMEEGLFRRDLYFRVAGFALRVPPLRERREDIPGLVNAFIGTFLRDRKRALRGITVKALRALTEYAWPGNVRELEHEVRRLVYLCPDGEAIDSAMISPHVLAERSERPPAPGPETLDLETHVDALERRVIRQALLSASGNRTQAAELLGISRNGLAIKMKRLGLSE
jgi:DNA-binding NtrC family response regulator